MKDLSEKIEDCVKNGTAIIVFPSLDVGIEFVSFFELAEFIGLQPPCDISFHCLNFDD